MTTLSEDIQRFALEWLLGRQAKISAELSREWGGIFSSISAGASAFKIWKMLLAAKKLLLILNIPQIHSKTKPFKQQQKRFFLGFFSLKFRS